MNDLTKFMRELRTSQSTEFGVLRKSLILSVFYSIAVAYYRHFLLAFGYGEPLAVTLGLGVILILVVGVFGGILCGQLRRLAEKILSPKGAMSFGTRRLRE
jgi:hypothetical protein